uniref:Uncharacterized protein n=1 Tax=Rhizophagus clarus TaxID=94130 RepID=A0A140D085_9GLOM|nr:hypothetical protein [Rhizophagus clarus]
MQYNLILFFLALLTVFSFGVSAKENDESISSRSPGGGDNYGYGHDSYGYGHDGYDSYGHKLSKY